MVLFLINMTDSEKFNGIVNRIHGNNTWLSPLSVSVIVITSYLHALAEKGLIAGGYAISDMGKNIVAVCEEFDWKPTDEHVIAYVQEMILPEDQAICACLIFKFRDAREELMAKLDGDET